MDFISITSLLGSIVPDIVEVSTNVDTDEKIISIKVFIAIIATVGGSLGTAITILFKSTQDLNKKYANLSKDFGRLEGKQDGIRELSYRVLDTVHQACRNRDDRDNIDYHKINKNKNDFLN